MCMYMARMAACACIPLVEICSAASKLSRECLGQGQGVGPGVGQGQGVRQGERATVRVASSHHPPGSSSRICMWVCMPARVQQRVYVHVHARAPHARAHVHVSWHLSTTGLLAASRVALLGHLP